jgi:hypothetical protein
MIHENKRGEGVLNHLMKNLENKRKSQSIGCIKDVVNDFMKLMQSARDDRIASGKTLFSSRKR